MLSILQGCSYGNYAFMFSERKPHLHAMLASCGYARETSPSYDWYGLKRGDSPFALIQYTVSGKGRLRYEKAEYELLPGTAMLLHFPHDNRYQLPRESNHWEFLYVVLCGKEVLRIFKEIVRKNGPVAQWDENNPVVRLIADIVRRGLAGSIASSFEASELAYSLCMELSRETLAKKPRSSPMDAVMEYCKSQALSGITVDDMARAAEYSRFHFTRIFTLYTGISPGRYLMQLRMDEALRMLANARTSVKAVAEQTGFCDVTYFTKMFKRHYGMTPGKFMKSGMFVSRAKPKNQKI